MQLALTLSNTGTYTYVKPMGRWVSAELMHLIMTHNSDGDETGWAKITYQFSELDAIGLERPIARIEVPNAECLDVEDISYALKKKYEDYDIEALDIYNPYTGKFESKTATL